MEDKVQRLLESRRFSVIKKYVSIEKDLEDFLRNHSDSLYRLYKLCLKEDSGEPLFGEDEVLFSFEVFFNSVLVYRNDTAFQDELDKIDTFMGSGQIPKYIEIVLNDKLFSLIVWDEVVLMAKVGSNLGVLERMTQLPVWERLMSLSYTLEG